MKVMAKVRYTSQNLLLPVNAVFLWKVFLQESLQMFML